MGQVGDVKPGAVLVMERRGGSQRDRTEGAWVELRYGGWSERGKWREKAVFLGFWLSSWGIVKAFSEVGRTLKEWEKELPQGLSS